jgi:2-C-methyl-D-erythritol 2,4-cyclodiphosphate synthase
MRVGIGYDVHRLGANRKLILGGVTIPYELGLLGHSDADVLTHAICDAMLGAAGLGDIGQHFPDTDPAYAGIDSLILLDKVKALISADYAIQNVDSTVIAQRPKLAPYIPAMRQRLAETLGISSGQINVKATTSEGLGFIGEGKAIAAQAIVCLVSWVI